MHALLIAIGSHGDVHPFVGLGKALRGRGHEVTVMASAHFASLVTRAGLGFLPFGTDEDYQQTALNPDLWHPIRGFRMVAKFGIFGSLPAVYEAAADFHRRHPDGVAAASTLALGARLAQEKLGVPLASVHLSPIAMQSVYETPRFPGAPMPRWAPRWWKRAVFTLIDALALNPIVGKPLNAVRAEMGLTPVKRVFGQWLHSPELVIGMFPDWFAAPQPDWPANLHLVGFPLFDERDTAPIPPRLENFLSSGAPPIAFTPGSAMWQGRAFFEASAEACRLAGRRGVLLTRHEGHLPPTLPPDVIHIPYAPFSQLLSRCSAIVHHGGIGTSAQSLAAGLPQLVMPMAHDQLDNAARLMRLGVARSIPPRRYRAPRVAAELNALLSDDRTRQHCRAAAQRFTGADPLAAACALLERLAETHRLRAPNGSPPTPAASRPGPIPGPDPGPAPAPAPAPNPTRPD